MGRTLRYRRIGLTCVVSYFPLFHNRYHVWPEGQGETCVFLEVLFLSLCIICCVALKKKSSIYRDYVSLTFYFLDVICIFLRNVCSACQRVPVQPILIITRVLKKPHCLTKISSCGSLGKVAKKCSSNSPLCYVQAILVNCVKEKQLSSLKCHLSKMEN